MSIIIFIVMFIIITIALSDSGFMFALDRMEVSEGLKGFGILLDLISFVVNLPSEKKLLILNL